MKIPRLFKPTRGRLESEENGTLDGLADSRQPKNRRLNCGSWIDW